ncbi:MAG TPA: phosphate/phosphite/phosphonate ABC transporter substrate-binding protein [Chloroflexota bacterium]|nr:phosphate/phosphite/phosphonate ABC transporter substrate-binding protein [Chloroflexota bacterium]
MTAQTLTRRTLLTGLTATAAGLMVAGSTARTSLAAPFFQTPTTLNLGFVPGEDAESRLKRYEPVTDYLKTVLEMEVKGWIGTDYTATVEAMRSRKVDAALYGPFSYVLAAHVADARSMVVSGYADGTPSTYNSLIVTHANSGITTVDELRGRSFSFVDPASTSGHLIPRSLLVKAGIEPDRDLKTIFAGGHDASLLAINGAKVDAGAVSSSQYQRMTETGIIDANKVVVLATSDPIPGSPWATRGSLDPTIVGRLRDAVLQMHTVMAPEVLKEFLSGGATQYVVAEDAMYDPIRDVARILNLDLTTIRS